ncbi:hypothetical protein IV102_06090 [bacterium]|nr:hypothetical protein [bacterium]
MAVTQWLSQVITEVGRAIERACFGQSHFRITTSEFSSTPTIDNLVQAKMALAEVRRQLTQDFSIDLRWPILLELKVPPAQGWKGAVYNPEGNMARHTVVDFKGTPAHQMWIRPGLTRARFKSLVAHELVHAFQREANFLNENLSLREGMARWVEFHFLKGSSEAERLLKLKHYTFGRSIEAILEYEFRSGRPATLTWLRSHA